MIQTRSRTAGPRSTRTPCFSGRKVAHGRIGLLHQQSGLRQCRTLNQALIGITEVQLEEHRPLWTCNVCPMNERKLTGFLAVKHIQGKSILKSLLQMLLKLGRRRSWQPGGSCISCWKTRSSSLQKPGTRRRQTTTRRPFGEPPRAVIMQQSKRLRTATHSPQTVSRG